MLTADEFAERFLHASRVLWTVAAGVLGRPTDAEDVLQEACVMALGKLDQYRRGTSFSAWMTAFVRNVARNHARLRQRRATTPTAPEVLAELPHRRAPETVPLERDGTLRADQPAFDDRVLAALSTLGETQRASLLLRAVLELSYREISETLSIPEGTAMSHVHRARVALRAELEDAPDRTALERRA